jgi:hypothetical protein
MDHTNYRLLFPETSRDRAHSSSPEKDTEPEELAIAGFFCFTGFVAGLLVWGYHGLRFFGLSKPLMALMVIGFAALVGAVVSCIANAFLGLIPTVLAVCIGRLTGRRALEIPVGVVACLASIYSAFVVASWTFNWLRRLSSG